MRYEIMQGMNNMIRVCDYEIRDYARYEQYDTSTIMRYAIPMLQYATSTGMI